MPSSPNGPWRTGKATSQPSSPPAGRIATSSPPASQRPSRSISTSTTSWPGGAQARRRPRRRSAARRRARTSARRRSPRPSSSSRASSSCSVGRRSVVGGGRGRRLGLGEHADDDRHPVAAAHPRCRRGGACSSTRPSSCGVVGRPARPRRPPSPRLPRLARAESSDCPTTSGTITEPAPRRDDDRHLIAAQELGAGRRVLVDHRALGLVGVAGVDVRDQPEPARAAPRPPPAGRRPGPGA